MKLSIQRGKNSELIITAPKLGLIIGFSETTEGEHEKLIGSMGRLAKEQFKCSNPPVDIHFQWKRKSFFIFNTDINALDNKMTNQIKNYAGKHRWGVIINGVLMKRSPYNILVLNEADSGRTLIMDQFTTIFEYYVK